MSTTITITRSIDVDIDLASNPRGDRAFIVTVDLGYVEPTEVARVTLYQSDDRPDGSARFTVTGSFVDNYAVEAKARKGAAATGLSVDFDSEMGQFFAYVDSFDAALLLGRKVAEAAVEVALERGEL